MGELQKFICTNVDDGDSFDGHFIYKNGKRSKKVTIRMIGVDTPESDQTRYKEMGQLTRRHLLGKVFDVKVVSKDVYGRFLADVYIKQGKELVSYNDMLEAMGFVYVRGQHHRPKWN